MKKILIVNNGLCYGGVEKSLINLLKNINYDRYEVDLYLFTSGNDLIDDVPSCVRIIKSPKEFSYYYERPFAQAFLGLVFTGKFYLALQRLEKFVRTHICKKTYDDSSEKSWKIQKRTMAKNSKQYDIAIGYMEGGANFYIADCISASRKIGWIHTDYNHVVVNVPLEKSKLNKLDAIITVSKNSKNALVDFFPELERRIHVVPNMLDWSAIDYGAKQTTEMEMTPNDYNIVSVGRLVELKGFQYCPKVCAKLREQGIPAQWFVVGEGSYRSELEKLIEQWDVRDYFHLVGETKNPYAYISKADICVQLSQYEGRATVVEEELYLKKMIVVSNINSYREQIADRENGIVVERNSEAVFEAISELYYSKNLQEKIKKNLSRAYQTNEEIYKTLCSVWEGLDCEKYV